MGKVFKWINRPHCITEFHPPAGYSSLTKQFCRKEVRASQVFLYPLTLPGKAQQCWVLRTRHTSQMDLGCVEPGRLCIFKIKQLLVKGWTSVCSLGPSGDFLDFFFHILMSIHYTSKSMPKRGTHVKVEINLRSSLFPSWKELNSARKHRDKVENQQRFLTRSNPHSSLPALRRLFITTPHRQCTRPLVICYWYKHRVA